MDENFDEMFSKLIAKEVISMLTGDNEMSVQLEDFCKTSFEILSFNSTEEALVKNADFVKAFGIARVKAKEVLVLANALLILKKKYKISDFDFLLLLEGLDEENLFGDE